MFILAIETSCDETAAAVISDNGGKMALLSNIVSSQVALHAVWGGVVPNLAAREHLKNIMPVVKKALQQAGVTQSDISAIAVTSGPGLIPALLIGVGAAKTLSYRWGVPLLGIHHIEGHIYANFLPPKREKVSGILNLEFGILNEKQNSKLKKESNEAKKLVQLKSSPVEFPVLCLVVSGGHTQLVLMKKHLHYKIVGETLDDAAGEAFDKVARILELGYPGGPIISAIAEEFRISNLEFQMKSKLENSKLIQNSKFKIQNSEFSLPRPMLNSGDFNFSFSGLKTAVLYLIKKNVAKLNDENFKAAVAAEFQQAAVDVLVKKTIAAAKEYKAKTILLAGGVSANLELRSQLGETVKKELPNTLYIIPDTIFTGDNAAMIGAAAYFRWQNMSKKNKAKLDSNWKNLEAEANLKLKN